MARSLRQKIFSSVLCLGWFGVAAALRAEPTPQQALYWWQDELRTVAAALGKSSTGQVAQWPAMTVTAGTAALPLPPTPGRPGSDGRLEESAWHGATRFTVGPLFDDWARGPFSIAVKACRDAKHVYLAIRSPRDLTGLGDLSAQGKLLAVNGAPYFLGPKGGIPSEAVATTPAGQSIELALPLAGPVTLTFPVEMLRRVGKQLPLEAACLGLPQLALADTDAGHFRHPTLWLQPIIVRLDPAPAGAQVVAPPAGQSLDPGIHPYRWRATVAGRTFGSDGFQYVESPRGLLAEARTIAERSRRMGSQAAAEAPTAQEVAKLESEARTTAATDRAAWRAIYCRARELRARSHLSLLDAPLLFVKQHPYLAGHIYDDFYPWHPGGGIYVLDAPHRPAAPHRARPVIDATTNETLGLSVYRDPEIHWDARQIVFAAKTEPAGATSVYEIGLDGRGLRRLTRSDQFADYQPAYLPDDRIVLLSTRPRALVPCNNTGVGTLHTMNRDGSDLRSISVNNVNEFDPAILPDGRILYGRWEYVDKTALYMQSLWTVSPDGRGEEALFKNNLARPTALLGARPVPGEPLVVAALTPHNGQAVGAIATIAPRKGKNNLEGVTSFTDEYPIRMDQGLMVGPCHPWPLSADDLLMANNAIGAHGIIELADRFGCRELVQCDAEISCYSPMLVKPRRRPPVICPQTRPQSCGKFLVTDVYQGLEGVPRGTVRRLRIIEETARTSPVPPGGRWWNQAFLVSWQGSYVVKNVLGVVPVEEDGSAYFEAPAGRAVYFEALDAEGRAVQRMRTFVQAAPGVTRSCIGCHEHKFAAPPRGEHLLLAVQHPPQRPQPESWGSGLLDYPGMVQPVLDRRCVACHGGPEGMAAGLDLSGGWTWAFNISYETLIKNQLVGFLNCENGSVHTSELLRPCTIGSGGARLADLLISGHGGRIPGLTRPERDLIFAWMDTNSNYHGSWDYTPHATCDAILGVKGPLVNLMDQAGCTVCHTRGHIGNDWVNLQTPAWSRILRAPLGKGGGGLGLAMCRQRPARPGYPLVDQSVQPPDFVRGSRQFPWDPGGTPQVSFASVEDATYRAMLGAIRRAQAEGLAQARIDMPGAQVVAGECRMQVPPAVPEAPPALGARLTPDGAVELCWQRTAETVGLQYEIHRGPAAAFNPGAATRLGLTMAGTFVDGTAPAGRQYYALLVTSDEKRGRPVWASVDVPDLPAPGAPQRLVAQPLPGAVALEWEPSSGASLRYDVFRKQAGAAAFDKLTDVSLVVLNYDDLGVEPGKAYLYQVRAVDRRRRQGPPSSSVQAVPLPQIQEPVFTAALAAGPDAAMLGGSLLSGALTGDAKIADGVLRLGAHGFLAFDHRGEFDLTKALSVECWVLMEKPSPMPVVISCGAFGSSGWFLQEIGGGWRWYLGGECCDGGRQAPGRWVHLVGTYDGRKAALYQDGKLVARTDCMPRKAPWPGPLVVGQYSSASPSYQVQGRIAGVKIYQRALRPEEVLRAQQGHRPRS
ncbi:MAG: LamG-like jellyroll fold domain-containing protein [Thermoguttaceae bacterium]|jgi:hypothetical protein